MEIRSRLPGVGTTIFSVMSKMALDHGAINLSQGFPDFPVDDEIIELVAKAMRDGYNQYAPMPGSTALRESISSVIRRTYGKVVDPDTEITITAGATEAIFSTIAAFISTGDEVIVFDPCYDSYDPAIRLNGGVPIHINLRFPEFTIEWDEVQARITNRTRMIMINTPHNPCGVALTASDLRELEAIASRHNLIVLSDEVYERLMYDGNEHQSVLRFPGLSTRSVAVFSFGKTFHATGWKVGYAIAPASLQREIRKAHQFITFSVNTPVQHALAQYLATPGNYEGLGAFYERKRDLFLNELKGSSLEPLPCAGSYFQLCSYQAIADIGDVAMAEKLTKEFRVAAIPVSVFYSDKTDNRLLRFCFAKRDDTLVEACAILRKL